LSVTNATIIFGSSLISCRRELAASTGLIQHFENWRSALQAQAVISGLFFLLVAVLVFH
jgi:hypothetical protein